MSFYGSSFIYNGTSSDVYGLRIAYIDVSAINKSMGSSSVEILEKKIYRRSNPYFYGATPTPKLSFPLSAFAEHEIDASHFESIQAWLFSARNYQTLQIDQDDIRDIYFSCFLTEPEINRVGNIIRGFTCQVVCNAPYAFKFPKTTTYTYTQTVVDTTETYYNGSDDKGSYLYPRLVITMNNIEDGISITNLDDGNRVSSFSGLSPNEVITIDSSLETISSSTGLKRLSNFNKKFLRLVPGRNRLRIQGNASSIAMTNQWVAKKIGG